MKAYTIEYVLTNDGHKRMFVFCDGEYFGDTYGIASAAKYPKSITYWRSEWKKHLKGVKSVRVHPMPFVPFDFLEDINKLTAQFLRYDTPLVRLQGLRNTYKHVLRNTAYDAIHCFIAEMLKIYIPAVNQSKKIDSDPASPVPTDKETED